MEYKDHHLRVDLAIKQKPTDKNTNSNKRTLFLGGLPFDVSDEDVYKHFLTCGSIEYVRIIRDNKTGIGKGFGYVCFKTEDTIALAMKLDGSILNERKIRVTRCVKKQVINYK
jgi:nucleolar protein 12